MVERKKEKMLRKIGVKDSKQLSARRREELFPEIEEIANSIIIIRVPACMIDSYRRKKVNLNKIEAMKMAQIIKMSDADEIYIDAVGVNPNKFKELVKSFLEKKVKIVAENFADQTYPIVSAASIIAKVERDREINKIKKREGFDFRTGYSHDEKTIEFLKRLMKERKELPSYVRKTWLTVEVLKESMKQRKLKEFLSK